MQSEEKGMNGFDKDIKYSLCKPEFKSSEIQTRYFLVLFGGNSYWEKRPGKDDWVNECTVLSFSVLFLSQYFPGSRDKDSVRTQPINPPIIAKFIRLRPRGWRSHICMRVEFYGCPAGTNFTQMSKLLYRKECDRRESKWNEYLHFSQRMHKTTKRQFTK